MMLLCIMLETCFKGTVSRDFGGLQMILMDRLEVPSSSAACLFFLNLRFHTVILIQSFQRVKLLLLHLANA
jgi:hypothetical protein